MTDGAVGTAEIVAGETEPRDFDGAIRPTVPWAVVIDLDQFKVIEDVTVGIESYGDTTTLKRQEGSEYLGT